MASGIPSSSASPTTTKRKSLIKTDPHDECDHTFRLEQNPVPHPTADDRVYLFKAHCLVARKWSKIKVKFAYFWYGDKKYRKWEILSGTIMEDIPVPDEV